MTKGPVDTALSAYVHIIRKISRKYKHLKRIVL